MKKVSLFLLLALALLPAMAARLPGHYPSEFQAVGIVNQVNMDDRVLVVNNKPFPVSGNAAIHDLRTPFTNLDALQAGDKIGFRLEKIGDNRYMLAEIWILPADYQLQFG